MKVCDHCRRENDDERVECAYCTRELPAPMALPEVSHLPVSREFIDLEKIEDAFEIRDGLSRPDWKVIYGAIEASVLAGDRDDAWYEVAAQWLDRLRTEMGGSYHVVKSRRFLMLSPLGTEATGRMLDCAENALSSIEASLGDLKLERKRGYGPHVMMLFDEDDDYYQYVSGFHNDGVHPTSGGMHIGGGYAHTVICYRTEVGAAEVIGHELSHQAVNHLKIPLWLNEGMAQVLEKTVGSYRRSTPLMTRELAEEHRSFWTEERLQQFWAGTSFHETGDARKLSYGLAEIMMNLLTKDHGTFLAFLRAARPEDSGQTASLDVLGVCLGETISGFLGEGNWRPQRKAIKECWEAERKGKAKDGE
jgi:hypothetical protein